MRHYAYEGWCQLTSEISPCSGGCGSFLPAGHCTLSLTLSDGNQFIHCYLSRTMFNLIDQCKFTVYDVVQVNKFTTNRRRDDSVAIFLLDISMSESMDDVLSEPVCYTNVRSTSISITPDDCGVNVRHKSTLSENVCTALSNTFKCQLCEDENFEGPSLENQLLIR